MRNLKKYVIVFFVFLAMVGSPVFGASNIAPPKPKKDENRITTWMTLSLLGKNQAEIEYYFRKLDKRDLEDLKTRMRFTVMDNLRRSGITELRETASDADDLRVIRRKVITEIRYMGMEHDKDLQTTIKEEFGVSF